MNKKPSRPLLRAATMGALGMSLLSCNGVSLSSTPSMEDVADSTVVLRGVIAGDPVPGRKVYIDVATVNETRRVPIPDGPWPRPFLITDADLEGMEFGETVVLTAFFEDAGVLTHMSPEREFNTRMTIIQLAATLPYQEVAKRKRPGGFNSWLGVSKLDLQGEVTAFTLEPSQVAEVSVQVVHKDGEGPIEVLPPGPFPRPFHLAGPQYAHVPVDRGQVEVRSTIRMSDGRVFTLTNRLAPLSKRAVLTPSHPPPEPKKYGNTKGSAYDNGLRKPRQGPPKK